MRTPLIYDLLGCRPGCFRLILSPKCVWREESLCAQQRRWGGHGDILTCHRGVRRQHTDISSIEKKHFIRHLQKYWPEYMIRYVWRKIKHGCRWYIQYMTINTDGTHQTLAPFKGNNMTSTMCEVFHCAHHRICSFREQYANLSGHT